MAKVMTENPELENTHLIKQCTVKTKELLVKIETVKQQNENQLTLEIIKGLQLNPDLEKFLYNVAVAELMTSI